MSPHCLDECHDCREQQGLCGYHARFVLPRLAVNVGWLKLMGEALTEQKGRQTDRALSVSPEAQAHQERKKRARRKSIGSGLKGLLKAVAA